MVKKEQKSQIFVPHLYQQKVIKILLAAYFSLASHQQTVKKSFFLALYRVEQEPIKEKYFFSQYN